MQVWDPKAQRVAPSVLLPSLRCLSETALFMAAYLHLVATWNVATFKAPWFLAAPFHIK
jgi:hypothetical protein